MKRVREIFLLHRVRTRQDAQAYAELYDAYVQRIYRFIFFKVPTTADAEELTSEVFMQAWSYLCVEKVRSLSGYLFTVARRTIADYYREKARDLTDELGEEAHRIPDKVDVEAMVGAATELDRVLLVLREIHDEYRDVLIMRYLEQLEVDEIAQALGKTKNNVRVLIHRAKAALRTALKQNDNVLRN